MSSDRTADFEATVHRLRGRRVTLRSDLIAPIPTRRPLRVARMLAVAHHFRQMVERAEVSTYADLARAFGMSRARFTQLLRLTLLAPDIQEEILFWEADSGPEPFTERSLRPITRLLDWHAQRTSWASLARNPSSTSCAR